MQERTPSEEPTPVHEPNPVQAPAPFCESPESQAIVPPSKPSFDDNSKATAIENHNPVEAHIKNHQRAAQSGNDALRVVAECKSGAETQAPERMDVDMETLTTPLAPESTDEDSIFSNTPRSVSMSLSASTDISAHLRQRSAETVEAAVTLNAVAAEAARAHINEEDGQSRSVDIMHGADLLLWAAGAVDPDFISHTTPGMSTPGISTQKQYEIAQAAIAASSPRKQKPRKPKGPKKSRKKSLIVVLKVPSTNPPSVNGEAESTESTPVTPSPRTPNWPIPSPKLPPANIPPPIPRPQPYRKPESGALKPESWTSTMDALATVRRQTELMRSAKANAVIGNTNIPSSPVGEASPSNPFPPSQAIPRPAYAKPGLMNGSLGSTGTRGASADRSPAIPPISYFPMYPLGGNFFNQNEMLNGAGGGSPPMESNNTREERASDVRAGDAARATPPFPGVPRATLTPEYIEVKKIAPLVSKNNFLYWEPNMVADVKPLIGKSPSYFVASDFGIVADFACVGENSGRSPIDASPGFAPGYGLGIFHPPTPLQPLSDIMRSTTAPPPQPRPPLRSPSVFRFQQPQPPRPPQQPTASASAPQSKLVNPSDMVFNITRYQRPDQKMVVHGRDILSDSPGPQKAFVWKKLVALLLAGLQYDDFRESLIVNDHHMVEDQAELNEGLEWFKRQNEVVVVKVNGVGNPPAELVARMKKARKALRPGW